MIVYINVIKFCYDWKTNQVDQKKNEMLDYGNLTSYSIPFEPIRKYYEMESLV